MGAMEHGRGGVWAKLNVVDVDCGLADCGDAGVGNAEYMQCEVYVSRMTGVWAWFDSSCLTRTILFGGDSCVGIYEPMLSAF